MAEAFGIACHELVSLDFRFGSTTVFPQPNWNVCSWVISRPQIHATGLPSLATIVVRIFDTCGIEWYEVCVRNACW